MDYRHLQRHSQGARGSAWVSRFVVRFPANEDRPTPADVRHAAEEMLKSGGDPGDTRYVSIGRADLSEVEYHFDGAAWIRDNFGSLNPQLELPRKLAFRYQNQIPRFIYTSASGRDLERFILSLFKEHLERNKRSILTGTGFGQVFQSAANVAVPKDSIIQSLLSGAVERLFDLELDYQRQRIIAKLNAVGVGIVMHLVSRAGSASGGDGGGSGAAVAQQSASSSGAGARAASSSSSASGNRSNAAKQRPRASATSATPEMQNQLTDACRNGDLGEVKRLLSAGVDVNVAGVPSSGWKDPPENTPLWFAARWGHVSVVKFLVESGANVNAVRATEHFVQATALNVAVKHAGYDTTEIVRYPLDRGADPTIRHSRKALVPVTPNSPLIQPGDEIIQKKDNRGRTETFLNKALNAREYAVWRRGDRSSTMAPEEKSRMDQVVQMLGGRSGRSAAGRGAPAGAGSRRGASRPEPGVIVDPEEPRPNRDSHGSDGAGGAQEGNSSHGARNSATSGASGSVATTCPRCGYEGVPTKKFSWLLLLLLLLFTSIIGPLVYVAYYTGKQPDRCAMCGAKLPQSGIAGRS